MNIKQIEFGNNKCICRRQITDMPSSMKMCQLQPSVHNHRWHLCNLTHSLGVHTGDVALLNLTMFLISILLLCLMCKHTSSPLKLFTVCLTRFIIITDTWGFISENLPRFMLQLRTKIISDCVPTFTLWKSMLKQFLWIQCVTCIPGNNHEPAVNADG